jgi:hypothetical protein
MNEAELEQLYAAALGHLRTELMVPFGEFALAITQAASAWRKTLTPAERQDANQLTRIAQTVQIFRNWVITEKPKTKAAQGLSGDKPAEQIQALIALLACDVLNDKYEVAVATGLPQFADRGVASLVIRAKTLAITRQAAFEALMHGQKTLLAIPADDPLPLERRVEIFTEAVRERTESLVAAWVLPALASVATALPL